MLNLYLSDGTLVQKLKADDVPSVVDCPSLYGVEGQGHYVECDDGILYNSQCYSGDRPYIMDNYPSFVDYED